MPPDVFAWNTLYFRPGGDRNNHAYVDSHTLTLASSSNPVSQLPRTSRAGATSNHHCQRSEQSYIFSVLYGRFGSFYVCSEPTASAAKAHELYKQEGGLKKARELYEEARGALFGRRGATSSRATSRRPESPTSSRALAPELCVCPPPSLLDRLLLTAKSFCSRRCSPLASSTLASCGWRGALLARRLHLIFGPRRRGSRRNKVVTKDLGGKDGPHENSVEDKPFY